jgi:hypothetical protein
MTCWQYFDLFKYTLRFVQPCIKLDSICLSIYTPCLAVYQVIFKKNITDVLFTNQKKYFNE